MNANELADKLENKDRLWSVDEKLMVKTCAMLRQQQEKLTKYELRHVAQRDRIAILEMQHKQQQAEIEELKKEAALQRLSDFTQEAEKTLTDEEIEVLASKHLCYQIEGSEVSGVFNFAIAILRKAQEK